MEFNVMTFNLRLDTPEDNGNSWIYRSDKVTELIRRYNPIVFGTQEALPNMINDLERGLEDYEWLGESRRENDEYSAIFYKKSVLKPIEQGTFWLSESPDVPESKSWNSHLPRICTWCLFESIKDPKKQFYVYNTHLDHISEQARNEGIRLIIKRISTSKRLPSILMGDFNASTDSFIIQYLRNVSERETTKLKDCFSVIKNPVGTEIGCTFHDFQGDVDGSPIDFIFTTTEFEPVATEIIREKIHGGYPSDHYPILTSLRFAKSAGA
ncbi:endonuclease/exonuclease/phosphatase family protein [Radiobacillus sp. PE A8.2]|uniref:endonuclease/exonuclease/phosphatase family protein n=1 Tax=Radiobacillus sp. PE A8.2 TaxID=3380349 RepID=UPI00388E6577